LFTAGIDNRLETSRLVELKHPRAGIQIIEGGKFLSRAWKKNWS
jgi:hypothetical protein